MKDRLMIHIQKLQGGHALHYATPDSAGFDIAADIAEDILIFPNETALIRTGLQLAIPSGYELQIRPRSGLALKNSVTVLNTPGTIDADYRGEIGVILINHGQYVFQVTNGMRIAQGVVAKVERANFVTVSELPSTDRGAGGFGSTGV